MKRPICWIGALALDPPAGRRSPGRELLESSGPHSLILQAPFHHFDSMGDGFSGTLFLEPVIKPKPPRRETPARRFYFFGWGGSSARGLLFCEALPHHLNARPPALYRNPGADAPRPPFGTETLCSFAHPSQFFSTNCFRPQLPVIGRRTV